MPLWGTPQSGNNPISALNFTDMRPGDDLALFDGTEAIVTGSKSIAFARGYAPGGGPGFTVSVIGCPGGSVIDVQQSNGVSASQRNPPVTPTLANMDAAFNTVLGDTINGNGSSTDVGGSSFYRLIVTDYVSGDVPVAIVKVR